MTTFYICRHGETENNKNRRLSGWIDTALTEQGALNAKSSAAKLKGVAIDKMYSSDMGRAFITAYLIEKELGLNLNIERLKDLREVNYGDLANLPYSEYPDLTPEENTNYIPPNGESLAQMQTRVLGCIKHISDENPGKTVLIVGHDGTINAIHASLTGESMGQADQTHNPHDFIAKFLYNEGKISQFVSA
jgi:broad specificity phosphatase PhoE